MNSTNPQQTQSHSERARDRREQILEAAAECFRRSGFHGASMAEIAKAARMSPGHIYNLFENKDEIIAAIVERDRDEIVRSISEIEEADDLAVDVAGWIENSIEDITARNEVALSIEVLAEACRNPKLAAVVQSSELVIQHRAAAYVRKALNERGIELSDEEIMARSTVIGALFNGLMNQSISQPHMNKPAVIRVIRQLVRQLLTS
ncbi:TetR family transcriptional regulator [Hylemonella gracilis str. Niagara R]|uniref:TetR family transcriptional regulator n=1 Tax=Hylemonella gracilis str. Niagara R TaxID=1458275 RepID=A0A016XK35_9BURK|nr:TetR/AcrR family transcriptional regulator [Hylemonella gracilis]EYC52211.1 TetR family transcriptional regulator [Hylemonella gracilis str. Niagara R]